MKIIHFFYNRRIYTTCILAWLLFQIIWIVLFSTDEWYDDYGLYQYFATICAGHGTMYPDYSFYHNEYIFAPGWINILILWFKVFGDFVLVPYLLLIFNVLTFLLTNLICMKLSSNSNIHYTVGYLYLLTPTLSTANIELCSDISFAFFATFSFYLTLKNEKLSTIVAALLIAIGLWIRPLGWAWIFCAIIFYIAAKRNVKNVLIYVIVTSLACGSIGVLTHRNFPDYLFTASTGGVNLIMGANDKATGDYLYEARAKGGLGYLPGLVDTTKTRPVLISKGSDQYMKDYSDLYTYSQCDSIYKSRSAKWIVEHPIKWCSTIPNKIKILFLSGSFIGKPMPNNNIVHKTGLNMCRLFGYWEIILISVVFILSLLSLCTFSQWTPYIYYVFGVIFITSAMTISCVASPRYNFIILNFLYLFFASTFPILLGKICEYLKKINK